MEKRIINPWGYQDIFDFMPAVEMNNQQGIPFGSGQAEGQPSSGGMPSHLTRALENLKKSLLNLRIVVRIFLDDSFYGISSRILLVPVPSAQSQIIKSDRFANYSTSGNGQ